MQLKEKIENQIKGSNIIIEEKTIEIKNLKKQIITFKQDKNSMEEEYKEKINELNESFDR
jgi:hypothetical protein